MILMMPNKRIKNKKEIARYARFYSLREEFVLQLGLLARRKTRNKGVLVMGNT